jgi:rubrerythrin
MSDDYETTRPADPIDPASLIADLNDLLQLDHDAVNAYTVAIDTIKSEAFRAQLVAFRADHKCHIEELAQLVRERGAIPVELPHLSSGPFKLAMQALAAPASDAVILLAFKANERQVRDKYRDRAHRPYPSAVAEVVRRAAADEERHYAWVTEALESLGYGSDSVTGQLEKAVELGTRTMADVAERVERQAGEVVERVRRGLRG